MSGVLDVLEVPRERVVAVLEVLRRRGETVATAESLTAGLVSAALTEVAGASDVVRGGMVVYATDLKSSLAGVDADLLDEHGPVHPRVAEALAAGARLHCAADWGIGLTGVAGPDPQDGTAPGTVHLGFAGPDETAVCSVSLEGDRHAVRAAAVRATMEHFTRMVR
ncbi:nicotinamide-nucleotide amidase [Halopolyspora algeriensis]|uniref:Nicotinamide-nucleotide amidase n=1 Tax=Halopolyspora algeriensis TaxID=1500506 RepID=A0A368VNJ7_9ACTN|nr:CinA family protein [Halopolyspora algeriensis]RCW43291.1 nicotinamide-nucleotide amidase [Halopolyspora algeriensis]TQM56350.1 nicotinamide-nucleotide amidase [Halopolyspora algeriensis]